jgi:hypothetical protein
MRVHTVLTSLVSLVLHYEISAPQDTLDKKKTLKLSSCSIFPWGISSQQSLSPCNTGTDLDHLLHYDTMYGSSCESGLQGNYSLHLQGKVSQVDTSFYLCPLSRASCYFSPATGIAALVRAKCLHWTICTLFSVSFFMTDWLCLSSISHFDVPLLHN